MLHLRFTFALFLTLLFLTSSTTNAQIRASEYATLTQVVDGTEISIAYSRPSIRDRGQVFGGGIVKTDHRWTPGANWATTFEFSKDVTINGNDVAAGKYSVWLITYEGDWELVLDPEHRKWHMDYPKEEEDLVRFMVTPKEVDKSMETFVFTSPASGQMEQTCGFIGE